MNPSVFNHPALIIPKMKSILVLLLLSLLSAFAQPIDIASRRELFTDDHLIQDLEGGIALRLHHPRPREIVIVHDALWEGTGSGYHSVFKDGDLYRMYYKAWHIDTSKGKLDTSRHPLYCCYAESDDGISWRKPDLGLHEFEGSKANNISIISETVGELNVDAGHPAVFKDGNPNASDDARYKAILRSREPNGLIVYKSSDGITWSPLFNKPILRLKGAFDSQNLAFWDPTIRRYRAYWRIFTEGTITDDEWKPKGIRAIRTGLSDDLEAWEKLTDITYEDSPPQQLYTNGVLAYHRAPHILIGFPTRYLERDNTDAMKALPDPENRETRAVASPRYGYALSEGLFMASRDGTHFKRWNEAFLRPGPERPGTWHYGAHYLAWGVVETASSLPGAPKELSLYATEQYWHGNGSALRRYTLRLDGFVSASAGWNGGTLLTRPLTFKGSRLELNFSTSAAGSIRVEIQDKNGDPLPGFSLEDCPSYFGDSVKKTITWNNHSDLSAIAGQSVQILFELKDGNLFSFRFQ
jgi:hypothetical protein